MLEVRGLSKSFGGFRAVTDVDLAVAEGEIAAVIGPNGAGKSTLFNLITGHLQPTAGRVLVDGRDITGMAPFKVCSMGMGRSFQRTNIFPKLTVLENVQAAFLVHRGQGPNFWSRSERLYRADCEALLASIGLAGQAWTTAGTLSYGNQKHRASPPLRTRGRVCLDRGAGANELPIAEGVVQAGDERPELAIARPRRGERRDLARVRVLPLVGDAGLDRVGRVLERVVLA